jgi:hypothetical protein
VSRRCRLAAAGCSGMAVRPTPRNERRSERHSRIVVTATLRVWFVFVVLSHDQAPDNVCHMPTQAAQGLCPQPIEHLLSGWPVERFAHFSQDERRHRQSLDGRSRLEPAVEFFGHAPNLDHRCRHDI